MKTFETDVDLGDRVTIDEGHDLVASVTAIMFRSTHALIEVSWMHCGDAKTAWVEPRRLRIVP